MKNYAKINKKWWNAVTPVHSASKLYNLDGFKKGQNSLVSIELEEVGNVRGKTLLHLMCHFGMDTLSWARRGWFPVYRPVRGRPLLFDIEEVRQALRDRGREVISHVS